MLNATQGRRNQYDVRQAQPIRRKAGATTVARLGTRAWGLPGACGFSREDVCAIGGALLRHCWESTSLPVLPSRPLSSRLESADPLCPRHCWDMAETWLGIDKSWDTRPIRSCQPLVSLFTSPRHRGLKGPLLARHCGRQWDHSMASCVGKGLMSRGRACSASRGACLPVGCTGAPSDCSRVLRHPPSKKKIQFFSLCCGVDNLVCGETLSGPVVICWAQKLLNG